jgi:predicted NBD/HSP70 family sugar kinase
MFRPAGKAKSDSAGQRQVMVQMNPTRGWAIGVTLDYGHANAIVLDAAGQRMDQFTFPIKNDLTQLPKSIEKHLNQWIIKHQRPAGDFLGIGIGVPGIVDHQQGRILLASRFNARNIPIRDLMKMQFPNTTIVIDHNTHLAALAEVWCGVARKLENFLYFMINSKKSAKGYAIKSYGLTAYLGGRVHRGAAFASGELDPILRPNIKRPILENEMAILGDPDAPIPTSLKQLALRLAKSFTPLINLLDPQAILLSGNTPWVNKSFIHELSETCGKQMLNVPGRTLDILPVSVKQHAVSFGSALAVIDADLCSEISLPLCSITLDESLINDKELIAMS